MDKPKIRDKHGPEYGIQKEIVKFLRTHGWLVERMVGGAFQSGIPDLYIAHPKYGQRWLECKNPDEYNFTKAQKYKFPIWAAMGIGIWILVAATEAEYDKLFKEPNWECYWKKTWVKPDIDAILEELDD
jgi:hypothetical protein